MHGQRSPNRTIYHLDAFWSLEIMLSGVDNPFDSLFYTHGGAVRKKIMDRLHMIFSFSYSLYMYTYYNLS